MGTRADFYIGRGKDAKWLGSIAFDGYPDGINKPVLKAKNEKAFTKSLAKFFQESTCCTLPEQGWPWPWDDSGTSDFAYAFDGGKVWASCFGHAWFDPLQPQPETEGPQVEFPNMAAIKKVATGNRSGMMVFTAPASH